MTRRWGHHNDPDEDRCRCLETDGGRLVDDDCPVHGDPEPPEPDPHDDQLELDLRDKGTIPF